ncbi:MAG: type II secretion system protein F, partial [Lachnospiraceae bacterium]
MNLENKKKAVWTRLSENLKSFRNLKIRQNLSLQVKDYNVYNYSLLEWCKYTCIAFLYIALISYVFYRNIYVFLFLSPFSLFYPKFKKKSLIQKRKKTLEAEFKEAILVLASLLSAGFSIENAVKEAVVELRLLYDKEVLIIKEFEYIQHRIYMKIPVEKAFEELGEKSHVEDIKNFARVLKLAKRSGGELVSIINHTANIIHDKIRIKEEIVTMTTAKRFEQKIMNLFPIFIILYVDLTSPGFFTVMYTTFIGKAAMSICLLLYIFAMYISDRLL